MLRWIIEKDRWGEDLIPLMDAINDQGMDYKAVTYVPFEGGDYRDLYPADTHVIAMGSINLLRQLRRENLWWPTTFANFEELDCVNYCAQLGADLVNDDYVFIPFGDLRRREDWLFKTFGIDDFIFMRPTGSTKAFAGHLFDKPYFVSWLNGIEDMKPADLVMVSSPKSIEMEWRFFMKGDQIMTGTTYKRGDQSFWRRWSMNPEDTYSDHKHQLCVVGEMDKDDAMAGMKAIAIARRYQPDHAFVLDIAKMSDGLFRVVEPNAACCSGIYGADPAAIIRGLTELVSELAPRN